MLLSHVLHYSQAFSFKYLTERSYYVKRTILEIHGKIELDYLVAITRMFNFSFLFLYFHYINTDILNLNHI